MKPPNKYEADDDRLLGKEDGVQRPARPGHRTLDFNKDGWLAEMRHDGLIQITGRSPRNTHHALFKIVKLTVQPGSVAVAENEEGEEYLLVQAALH